MSAQTVPDKGELLYLRVDKLVALKRNPQYLSEAQMDALKDSMQRDGFLAPILVRPHDDDTFEVLSGNHRVMAARELGIEEVPALVRGIEDRQAGRIAVNLNTVHGDPTAELLAPFLAELDDDTLLSIHLDDDLLANLKAFDSILAEQLAQLQPPPSLNNESPGVGQSHPCICPTCGRQHIRKQDD